MAIYHSTKLAASLLQLVKRLRWQRGSTVTDEQHKAQVERGECEVLVLFFWGEPAARGRQSLAYCPVAPFNF